VNNTAPAPLGVAVVGLGWMGQVHARALTRLPQHYPDTPLLPHLVAVAEPVDDARVRTSAAALGFDVVERDWQAVVARDDVDLVCVTGPNFIHRDVAVAAADAGKHLWVEKPAGRSSVETAEIVRAVERAGVQAAAGFNYRNVPAVQRAREIIQAGQIGRVETVNVRFAADYSAHPAGALSWRFTREYAGSGVLGDLVSHAADLARFVAGPITQLVADQATFIPQRPQARPGAMHYEQGAGELGQVENEDYASALVRFASGARGILESSRCAVGQQNAYGFTIQGTHGALAWDFRAMNQLSVCADQDFSNAYFATQYVGPGAGDFAAFQPGPNNPMGFDDLKVIEAKCLIDSIASGQARGATIRDALVAAQTVDAMIESATSRQWVEIDG
jgi:predicted dehydrogenase